MENWVVATLNGDVDKLIKSKWFGDFSRRLYNRQWNYNHSFAKTNKQTSRESNIPEETYTSKSLSVSECEYVYDFLVLSHVLVVCACKHENRLCSTRLPVRWLIPQRCRAPKISLRTLGSFFSILWTNRLHHHQNLAEWQCNISTKYAVRRKICP